MTSSTPQPSLPAGTEVFADADAIAEAAADRIVATLAARPPHARLALCLAGGSTPKRLYARLATAAYRDRVAWSRTHWFWGDERMVPPTSGDSNARMAREALLDQVPVPAANLHPIPTDGTPEACAAAYEATLRAFHDQAAPGADRHPLFDVVLLGLGADGHTASLFPGQAGLQERERWVVAVPQAAQPPHVPRVTLTLPALASCRLMLFLVDGESKRAPLARIAAGEPLPAARAGTAGERRWLVDRAAVPPAAD